MPEGRDQRSDVLQLAKKYAGLMPSEMKRLRQLEEENAELERLVADLSLDNALLQDVVSRKPWGLIGRASLSMTFAALGRSASGEPAKCFGQRVELPRSWSGHRSG